METEKKMKTQCEKCNKNHWRQNCPELKTKNKKYTFFYHYNKPASKAAGKNKLTLHWKKKCIIVDKIFCFVDSRTVDRKIQPRCVIKGQAEFCDISNLGDIVTAGIYNSDYNFKNEEFNLKN